MVKAVFALHRPNALVASSKLCIAIVKRPVRRIQYTEQDAPAVCSVSNSIQSLPLTGSYTGARPQGQCNCDRSGSENVVTGSKCGCGLRAAGKQDLFSYQSDTNRIFRCLLLREGFRWWHLANGNRPYHFSSLKQRESINKIPHAGGHSATSKTRSGGV
jgi:hypothetical protein